MYANFLAEFGLQIERRIKAYTGGALHDAASINYDEEVAILAEAAKIIQRDIKKIQSLTATSKKIVRKIFYPSQ